MRLGCFWRGAIVCGKVWSINKNKRKMKNKKASFKIYLIIVFIIFLIGMTYYFINFYLPSKKISQRTENYMTQLAITDRECLKEIAVEGCKINGGLRHIDFNQYRDWSYMCLDKTEHYYSEGEIKECQ